VRRLVCLWLLLSATPASAERGDGVVWFEGDPRGPRRRESAYVGEQFEVVVRFQVMEQLWQAFAAQRFHQSVDLQLALESPWRRLPPGVRIVEPPEPPEGWSGDRTLVVDEAVETARSASSGLVSHGGGQIWGFRVQRHLACDRPGRLRFEAATLRWSRASRFDEDALGRRVPLGVTESVVRDEPIEIEILPLPLERRPQEFTGAVGRFKSAVRLVDEGSDPPRSVRLEVTLTGDGELAKFAPPDAEDVGGLRLLGMLERSAPGRRTFLLDVAAGEGPHVLPPLRFPYFQPAPHEGYLIESTEALPLPMLEADTQPPARSPPVPAAEPRNDGPSPWWLGLLGLLGLLPLLRRRRGRTGSTSAGVDLAALRARLDAPDADLAGAFQDLIAARLGAPPAAAVAPDLAARLARAGVEASTAGEVARAMESLVAARYGSAAGAPARTALLALADRLGPRPAPSGSS
jgi:MYXO-CTERM domain-containing protein